MVNVYVDSDWEGEVESKQSTSGGMAQFGNRLLKSWSTTQNVVALPSGEAEYYAIVNGGSVALGFKSPLQICNVNADH